MSEINLDDIVIGGTKPAQPATPIQTSLATSAAQINDATKPVVVRNGVNPAWVALFAFLFVLMLSILLLKFREDGVMPGPGPEPIDGAYVAIFYDDEGKDDYTEDQLAFIDSAATANYLSQNTTNWKKIDVTDIGKLQGLPEIFTKMATLPRDRLPWMVIKKGRKEVSTAIEDKDAATELLQKALQ